MHRGGPLGAGFARRDSPTQLTRLSTTGRSTARRLYEILRLRNGTQPASRAHFLAEKGLTVATVQVDLRNGEQFSPGP